MPQPHMCSRGCLGMTLILYVDCEEHECVFPTALDASIYLQIISKRRFEFSNIILYLFGWTILVHKSHHLDDVKYTRFHGFGISEMDMRLCCFDRCIWCDCVIPPISLGISRVLYDQPIMFKVSLIYGFITTLYAWVF